MAIPMGRRLALALLAALAWGYTPPAGAATSEDLTLLKLPHGLISVPEADAATADQGYVARFLDEKFCRIASAPGALETPQQVFDRMKREKAGDLIYSKQDQGSLFALSGRIMDLGSHLLQDFTKYELPAPRASNGTIARIQEGSVYLLQATDRNFVLVRLLHQTPTAVSLQYIYQPDGGRDFSVARGVQMPPVNAATTAPATEPAPPPAIVATPVPATAPAATLPALPVATPASTIPAPAPPSSRPAPAPLSLQPPAAPTMLVPYLETHLRQRAALIARRSAIIQAPARTEMDIRAKAQAIDDLRELRAIEAIPLLIDEISFLNPHATPRDMLSMEAYHPAVTALKALGKPATVAALEAIGRLTLDATAPLPGGDATRSASYRLHLLVLVLSGVEGPDVATFILRRAINQADAAHRPNYDAALKELGQ